ncbi:Uncharacterized protein TCM_015241 [Theobroma cacao]|uniref:Uncharacterized protein n=1 Tax=Theobroma cacao TaxID=3641 RepID=A0A061G155_THECC|nr:Uncharacterized protein TCM_015241 [Theobroma cacao]
MSLESISSNFSSFLYKGIIRYLNSPKFKVNKDRISINKVCLWLMLLGFFFLFEKKKPKSQKQIIKISIRRA